MKNKISLHCLIIDDDSGDIELVRRKLSVACRYAITVIPCQSVEALLLVPQEPQVDIVLLDYQLGAINGVEALTHLRELGYQQPVIMLTGQGNEQIAVEAMKSGVSDYLVKDDLTWQILEQTISNALKNVELEAKVEEQQRLLLRQATTDSLTGLNNRGYCLQRLKEAGQRAARYGKPLSLLMLDLDHFKHVNDNFGHPAGDKVLARTGQIISSILRETDIAGRYGGEEFVVALGNTALEGAIILAERLRQAMAREPIRVEATLAIPVTCSIGVSCLDQECNITDIDTLLKSADEALYLAKDRGRNQVAVNPRHEQLQGKIQVKCQSPECMVKKGRILIVDDDQVVRVLLRRMLTPSVEAIHEAASGVEALAILEREKVDVLITDLHMPEMDGLELMRQARSLFSGLQVIVVTGDDSRDAILTAMRLGAINYLIKPIQVEELSISIHQAMDRGNMLRRIKKGEALSETNKKSFISLMDLFPSPLLLIDGDGHCQFTNPAAARLFDIPSGLSANWRFGRLSRRQGAEVLCLLAPGRRPFRAVMRITPTTWNEAEIFFVIFDELQEIVKESSVEAG